MGANPFDIVIQTFLKSAGIEPRMAKERFEQAVNLIAGFDTRLKRIEETQREILHIVSRLDRPAIEAPANGEPSTFAQQAHSQKGDQL